MRFDGGVYSYIGFYLVNKFDHQAESYAMLGEEGLDWQVIGNIYEDPELLIGEQNDTRGT